MGSFYLSNQELIHLGQLVEKHSLKEYALQFQSLFQASIFQAVCYFLWTVAQVLLLRLALKDRLQL